MNFVTKICHNGKTPCKHCVGVASANKNCTSEACPVHLRLGWSAEMALHDKDLLDPLSQKWPNIRKGANGALCYFELWASKVNTGASGQKWVFALAWFSDYLSFDPKIAAKSHFLAKLSHLFAIRLLVNGRINFERVTGIHEALLCYHGNNA